MSALAIAAILATTQPVVSVQWIPASETTPFWYALEADDPDSVAVSFGRRFADESMVFARLDRASAMAGYEPQTTLTLFAGRPLGQGGKIDLYVWSGLNAARGDFGAGLTLRRTF